MIDYVDRLLKHWAQEMSVNRSGVYLGYGNGWGGTFTEGDAASTGLLTARGTASRSGPARNDLGKVAERVNQAVERLPEALQEVVSVQYLECPSLTAREKSLKLGCGVATLYNNIHRAHELLSDDLPDSYANS
jgi:DNA-directed RNA polymerase specialized sigma24 family protein